LAFCSRAVFRRCGDAASRADVAFLLDHQRHVDRFVVHEQPVLLLAVIAEALAVIARDDDESAIEGARRAHRVDEPRQLRVRIRDLVVVRCPGATAIIGRRRVGRVRIVKVDPHEPVGLLIADW